MSIQGYLAAAQSPSAWPALWEIAYQAQSRWSGERVPGARRPDITYPQRLLIASIVNLWDDRPHGMITWSAEAFRVSRETIYEIGRQYSPQRTLEKLAEPPPISAPILDAPEPVVSNHFARTLLTLRFPGGVTLRPMARCLEVALGQTRSPAWLSQFLNDAGERAGRALEQADWSAVRPFNATRDEKFFDDRAYLATVEPKSLAFVSGHVEEGVDAELWGLSLALDQLKTSHAIKGLAEDAATWYPASVKQAAALLGTPFLMPIQKDIYHVLARARQTLTDVERTALAKLKAAEKQATRGAGSLWIIQTGCFDTWKEAHAEANAAIDRSQELRFCVDCLHDAFEVVELPTGAIRDMELSEWYLEEILLALEAIEDRRVRGLATYIRKQQHQLFTFHEWLAEGLVPWRERAREHFGDADVAELFERAVAKRWRVQRAITNGRHSLHNAAERAEAEVVSLCQNDRRAACLALELTALLEEVVRTSSASECLNSLSNHFLATKRAFPERVNSQNFFNLLMLWHCMRKFERGKRKGKSPFEILGVRVFDPDGNETDDWMAALGYPEEAHPAAAAA